MKLKIFARKSEIWKALVPFEPLEEEVNRWLSAHPRVKIVEVKHDVSASFWTYTQFVISVYYTDEEKKA